MYKEIFRLCIGFLMVGENFRYFEKRGQFSLLRGSWRLMIIRIIVYNYTYSTSLAVLNKRKDKKEKK